MGSSDFVSYGTVTLTTSFCKFYVQLDEFTKITFYRTECWTGIVMENFKSGGVLPTLVLQLVDDNNEVL